MENGITFKAKAVPAFLFVLVIWLTHSVAAQTTVFSDGFSTNTSATYTTSGAIGSSAWTAERSGVDWGVRRNTSPAQLEITNDIGGTSNLNGWMYAYTSTASFLYPYNTTLSSNPNVVTWNFNMRQHRNDPGGFSAGVYGVAFVLGSTSTTVATAGNGYAVVLGNTAATDPVRLVSFTGGIQSIGIGLTSIISSNTVGLTDLDVDYLSVRVTYTPSTNTWQMFLRNDGASAFADPAAGTLTSQGTAVNSTYTGVALTNMGEYWQGSNGANETAFFDNVSVTVAGTALSASTSTISFGNVCTNITSTNPFTFNGAGLSGNITVAAPTDFTVSTDNVAFASSVTVTPVSNAITNKTIYVKFAPTAATSYSNNVTLSGGGATTVDVAVTGTGLPLTTSNAGSDVSICSGSTFTVSTDAAANYTSLAWTTSGSGAFSPNATSLHPTYTPSGGDISAGTVTLTLGATGTCNAASDPMSLTILPTGQWKGTSTAWDLSANWCGGIPTVSTDVILSSGVSFYPTIISPVAALCRNLTVNTGATLSMSSGSLSVYGNLQAASTSVYTQTGGTLLFAGSTNQTVSALDAQNVTLTNSAGITLLGNFGVSGTLTLNNGVVTTGSNELNVTNASVGAISNYSQARYVYGNLRRSMSGNGVYDFPIGTATRYERVQLNLHSLVGVSNAVAKFTSTINGADPNVTVNGTLINTCLNAGFWTVTPDASPSSGTYDITLYERGYTNPVAAYSSNEYYTTLKRANSAATWTHQGQTIGMSQSVSGGTITVPNYGLSSFSDFAIGFGSDVLPVTLTSFTATNINGKAVLNWHTASEYRNAYFDVERSLDGATFETLGTMSGNGTTDSPHDYLFGDKAPAAGVNYYRLKQMDTDGGARYSEIRAVSFNAATNAVTLYPVPAFDVLNVVGSRENDLVGVYDLTGKLLLQRASDGNLLSFQLNRMSSGTYLLKIESRNGVFTQLFTKQ